MNWRRIVWLLALVTLPTLAEETPLQLVLRGAQHDQLYQLSSSGVTKVSALPDSLTTPLGSLWKLYVYAWLEDTHQPEQPYQCRGNSPEEVYCCQAGESITRDTALVRSCGLYFAPQRLHIGADVWGQYWQQRQAPAWLASLTTLKPETSVTVKSLLDSLATLPAQNKAQEVLLDVVLDEAKIGVASMLGSRVRVKTWSWFADDKQEIRQGGFAGWLTDGTPLWVTGSGTSKTVLTRYATVLNRVLPVPTQVASGQCVEVELVARYPLKKITAEKSTTAVKPGVLNGRYRVTFTNGNHITFVSHGETTLLSEKGKLKLQSHLDREEYVARVLDREAKSTPPEAAKAMTVAIRTFLQQNANREGDCLTIPDSSATQRVSASPATTGRERWPPGRRISSMRAIRFIIMAVALPKGRFPGGKPRPRRGRESVTTRYSRLLIPTTALAAGERHAQPASYYPKRKPGWRKKCSSGGVYYKLRRGTTNQTCLRFAV